MKRTTLLVFTLIALLASMPAIATRAATPVATPPVSECEPPVFCHTEGFVWRVARSYEHVGTTYFSPALLQFGIAEYATELDAHNALATILVETSQQVIPGEDATGVTLSSIDPFGDEVMATGGIVLAKDSDGEDANYFVAYVVVRTGLFVRFGYAWAWEDSPLDDLTQILEESIALQPTDQAVEIDAFGISTGGLWDAVPPITALPAGYRFAGELR